MRKLTILLWARLNPILDSGGKGCAYICQWFNTWFFFRGRVFVTVNRVEDLRSGKRLSFISYDIYNKGITVFWGELQIILRGHPDTNLMLRGLTFMLLTWVILTCHKIFIFHFTSCRSLDDPAQLWMWNTRTYFRKCYFIQF